MKRESVAYRDFKKHRYIVERWCPCCGEKLTIDIKWKEGEVTLESDGDGD